MKPWKRVWCGPAVVVATCAAPSRADPSSIVAGVFQIVSPGAPGGVFALDPAWWAVAGGDNDTSFPASLVLARDYGSGHVVMLGHDGLLEAADQLDNALFDRNALAWLRGTGGAVIRYTTGHSEWVNAGNIGLLRTMMMGQGYSFESLGSPITASSLQDVAVLIVGDAWESFTASEITAVTQWVQQGGGLLLAGLGWSWEPYHPGTTIEDYPMTRIAAPFQARWLRNSITDPTNSLNGSPIFHTFYPNVQSFSVTEAMSAIQTAHQSLGAGLAAALESNSALRLQFANAHQTLIIPATELPAEDPNRQATFDFITGLVQQYPGSYAKSGAISASLYPTSVQLRERLWRTWVDSVPLTAQVKATIATAGQLPQHQVRLLNDFGVVLLDDCGLDEPQQDHLYTLLSLVPPSLHNLRSVSCRDFWGTAPVALWWQGVGGSVNVFGYRVGQYSENQFPLDVPPGYTDVFSSVAAHELNHVVDAFAVTGSPSWSSRKGQLLTDAGTDPMNYLRSMFPAGFFQQNPQEFVASVSNEWLADSVKTIELGLVRFDSGRRDPINQALFFADVYSQGGTTSWLYSTDTTGQIQRRSAALHRNLAGFIDQLGTDSTVYSFAIDAAGRVSGYSSTCYTNCDGSTTPPVLNVLDFTCFLNKFAALDPYANCDGSTTPPMLNVLDFACFLNKFAAGCP